jgi:phosphoribosyl 1,2-cyclic phosphate phosphodiesterase
MRITLLGTGDAGGTPRYGCDCAACRSLVRTPAHAVLESESGLLLLDTGAALPPERPDAVLLTHFHLDHVTGLFPLRHGVGVPLPVYAPRDEESLAFLFRPRGALDFRHPDGPFEVAGYEVTPVPLRHSVPTCGWLVRQEGACVAYLTDTKGIPEASRELLREAEPGLMILDCTWPPGADPDNHNDLNLALYEIDEIGPKRTVLTHLSHELDAWRLEERGELPPGVEFAREGQALAVV